MKALVCAVYICVRSARCDVCHEMSAADKRVTAASASRLRSGVGRETVGHRFDRQTSGMFRYGSISVEQ